LTATTCAPGITSPPLSVTVPTSAVCEASCAQALVVKSNVVSTPDDTCRRILDLSFVFVTARTGKFGSSYTRVG
jgi:hypothetical protein